MGGNDLTLGEDHVPTIQEGKDPVPQGHPLSPACPVLAPPVWGPDVSEEQPWHLPGKKVGRIFTTPSQSSLPPDPPYLPSSHQQELAAAPGDPQWMETIGRDLHRQFPLHEMFVSPQGHGQQGLLQVLKAYTLYRPEQGYCQAQGPVAAVLLMHLPPEEAFWCLVQICEVYLPGYYGPHMEAVQLDAEVFMALLRRQLPRVYKHLQQVGVGPLLYLPEWFLCLFTRSLPFPTVLRIWDAFLSEGAKVLFRDRKSVV